MIAMNCKIFPAVFSVFFWLLTISACNQRVAVNVADGSVRPNIDYIAGLRNGGCLFVRLRNEEGRLAQMEEAGFPNRAEIERRKIFARNQSFARAFIQEWTASPVYFFYEQDSEKVQAENLKNVTFLDENLEADATLQPACSAVLTAEFGFSVSKPSTEEDVNKLSEGLPLNALVLMDNNFVQLPKNFPNRARRYWVIMRRTDAEMVQRLNEAVLDFASE